MSKKKVQKRGNTFKWLVGILISLIAASGGIVKLLEYKDSQKKQKIENEKKTEEEFQKELTLWEEFSPSSLAKEIKIVELRGGTYLNLDNGHDSNIHENERSDLLFSKGGGIDGSEFLRAYNGATWSEKGVVKFEKIKYREIRDATYSASKHSKSGYPDLFYAYGSGVPRKGYVYFIKTFEGNVAKIQIVDYKSVNNNPSVLRNIVIKYEVFPIVADPPRPKN